MSAVNPVSPAAPAAPRPWLFEIAWEVCQQLGGIYTVIRSKIPSMLDHWRERYCLIGPYNAATAAIEFDAEDAPPALAGALDTLRRLGLQAYHGRWLVTGRPRVVLLDPRSLMPKLHEIKYFYWDHHRISVPANDGELDQVLAFGFLVSELFRVLYQPAPPPFPVVAHFHEWMGAAAIPEIRHNRVPLPIVFTTHATLLGRYLAVSDPGFYDRLSVLDWQQEARRFHIESRVQLERAATHGATIFTTVSNVTATECRYLLGRMPDLVLPNGLNIERFIARHESENLHKVHKERIHRFVISHFFPSYSFHLDRTLYFFTSGRYEYRNKGFDLTIEALARLNYRLKLEPRGLTVVFFLISKKPFRSLIAEVLNNKAMTEELHQTCRAVQQQVGDRLFHAAAMGKFPDINALVDDYWRLRLRRTIQACRSSRLPMIVTHDLTDQGSDEVLGQLRATNLVNNPDDPVKVVYHPDFITTTSPLFGMDYDQFVRGCHLGLFPSYYEPWGYTPLECLARGIPAVTSDLSGFGNFILSKNPDCEQSGLSVIHRKTTSFNTSADELTECLMKFAHMELRDRITQRFKAIDLAEQFDWKQLIESYNKAYKMALS